MPARSIAETSLTESVVRGALFRSAGIARGCPDFITAAGIATSPGGSVDHVAFHHFEGVTIAIFGDVKHFIGGRKQRSRRNGGLACICRHRATACYACATRWMVTCISRLISNGWAPDVVTHRADFVDMG